MPVNYEKYPPNWKTEIRPRILERAKHKCENCGVSNYIRKDNGKRVVLTIAHLDHDESNWNVTDERLKALCQACHFRYDNKDNQRRKRYGKGISLQPKLI